MKKFILKILTFVVPILVLAYGIDAYLSNNLRKSRVFAHLEYPIWNDILESNLNADILIHGSSRAWVHIAPKILEDTLHLSSYNLGVDGHTFNMQQLRHELALKYNEKPKMIIHSVDATTLQKGNFYNAEQILPFMLWDEDFEKYTSNYTSYSYLDYKLPILRYYGETDAISTAFKMSFKSSTNNEQRIKGYQGQERIWNQDFDNAKKIMKHYEVVIDEDLKQRFNEYLKACKASDIEVVLVYTPVYIEGQEFIKNIDEIKKTYTNFAETYNFKFFDFTNDDICFDKSYFYNARHLNKNGSELFTKKLASKIKTDLIKK
ncbi:hypothetical protein [Psychroserpens ponticola]|uniref:DUF1574 domain-containing protein n=1 Tax=Psychroserpens ponticola TaxID=2932268 RepID=A0ABY7RZQ2_9FLAO|nr:hypothetical protein [Psychroserpens ponticola]WCO02542.1 hypothetical protein MUN68_003375 [Psychroserpens ponticola]